MTRPIVVLGLWWLALAATFMLFTGEWTATDVAWAGAAALVALGLVEVMRRRRLLRVSGRRHWLPQLVAVPRQIVVDFGLIVSTLLRCLAAGRRVHGVFVARPFPAGGATPLGVGWRTYVTVAATLSPNSYVVDIDRVGGHRLNHDLVPHRASERPA